MYKAAKNINSFIDYSLILLFVITTLIGVYIICDYSYVYTNDVADTILPTISSKKEAEASIAELSDEAVAWIVIDDTTINYPVMHCDNNSKYLNTDPYGNHSVAGSIFLDSRNHEDFMDWYSIIYGHHIAHGYMFGALDEFENKAYLERHRTGSLYYGGEEHRLNIFAFAILDALDETFFNPYDADNNMYDYIKDHAVTYKDNFGGKILVLTTCREPGSTKRTLLFCEIL